MRAIISLLPILFATTTLNAKVLHNMSCAGFLDPNPGKVLDSARHVINGIAEQESSEQTYVIDGRTRRVNFVTARHYGVDYEAQPQNRLEVPMVNERMPLLSRQIRPTLANFFDANFFRGLKVLFNNPLNPKIVKTERRGVTRFTYRVSTGSSVDDKAYKEIAMHLYAAGFGRNKALSPETHGFEVAVGGKVYTGRKFYERLHELNIGNVPSPGKLRRFTNFMAGLSFAQIARNVFTPAEQKVGYRPRFIYEADAHGDLTPERMTEILFDLEDRVDQRAPKQYDVFVAGRSFTADEFDVLYERMVKDGITSIHAEAGFNRTPAGWAATAISQGYTWSIRAAAATVVFNIVPHTDQSFLGLTLAAVVAATPYGSELNYELSGLGNRRIAKVARALAYLIPNYSALFDSTNFYAVEARRATTLVDNVIGAIERNGVNEITIITNGTRDVERLRREFRARFPDTEIEPPTIPLLAVSKAERADAKLAQLADEATRAYSPRSFATAEEFLEYYNPNRVVDVRHADSRIVARAAFYFFQQLRLNVPEFFRLRPTAEQMSRLQEIPHLFEGYEFEPSGQTPQLFANFVAMRRAPASK